MCVDANSLQHGPSHSEGIEFLFKQARFLDFLGAGGLVGLGVIPTDQGLTDFQAEVAITVLLRACEATKLEPEVLIRQSLVTATCGFRLLDLEPARHVFEAARDFSTRLSTHAGLEEASPIVRDQNGEKIATAPSEHDASPHGRAD